MFAMSHKKKINRGFGLLLYHSFERALRYLAINLYRDAGFFNMAQAYALKDSLRSRSGIPLIAQRPLGQRKCQFGLKQILSLFRMK